MIDPALVYSTYLGGSVEGDPFEEPQPAGSATNRGSGVAVDGGGNMYIAGFTDAEDFPVTPGAYDTTDNARNCSPHGGQCASGFVSKFNASGSLVYSTYLGIDLDVTDLAVDSGGRAYIVGGFGDHGLAPQKNGLPFPRNCESSCSTRYGFLVVLNGAGSDVVYGTAIGTSDEFAQDGSTELRAVAVGATGVAYVTGETLAPDFPTTANAYQRTHSGALDVVVAKIDPLKSGMSSLLYSTYLGGTGYESGQGIATEGGRVYFTGYTASSDFPTSSGARQRTLRGGNDAFVARIDTNQSASLDWSTLLGGSSLEGGGTGIALLGLTPIVTGYTTSSDFPTTSGAYDRTHNGSADAFVSRITSDGLGLIYSTLYGGSRWDEPTDLDITSPNEPVVVGVTDSADLPTTPNAFDRSYNGGECGIPEAPDRCNDGFLLSLNPFGSALAFATYFGGDNEDLIARVDVSGSNAVIAGTTSSANFPVTGNAFQPARKGRSDAFLSKISLTAGCTAPTTPRTVRICEPEDGAASISPIHVSAAAQPGSDPILRMNIWVDGDKKYEQQNTTAVETDVPMASGSRRVTVQAADSAGTFKSTVFITVGGSAACPAPSTSRTINICEPADGATVNSPVRIRATAHSTAGVKYSQIYVDGKRAAHVNSAVMDATLQMAPGMRRITVQAVDHSTATPFKKTIFVTVR